MRNTGHAGARLGRTASASVLESPGWGSLVTLNPAQWAKQAHDLGLNPQADADLRSAIATGWVLERIRQALRAFPSYATPRAVVLSNEPWTLAAGLITPTLKPKRAAIESRYAAEIAALYQGH